MCRLLYVLTGPTAAGKTALALDWAETNGAEVVSCDASLFYRGMDIGTAKPTAAERSRVRHWLVDIRAVRERMDVARYVEAARAACADIVGRGRKVLVTGGSGFYLKAFFGPVADTIEIPDALRAEVAELERGAGLAGLVGRLRQLNPGADDLAGVDLANPRRVARALERCLATGRTAAALAAEFYARPGPFADWRVRAVVLTRPDADLRERIAARAAAMLRAGLVDEVRRLRAEGLEENPSAASAIGYRETLAVLRAEAAGAGRVDEARLAEEIAGNTWRLVRKQKTWFRTQLPAGAAREVAAAEARAEGLFSAGS